MYNSFIIIFLGEEHMNDIKTVNIDLVKGTLRDYIVKDANNIFIGRFTIIEFDKDNKSVQLNLSFIEKINMIY